MGSRGWGVKVGVAVVVAAVLGLAVWGGLTYLSGRDGEVVRRAAERVASGMSEGELTAGNIVDDSGATPDLAALVEDMGGAQHTVRVASVTEPADGSAGATLAHEWTLPGSAVPWTYETQLDLRERDGTWAGIWSPDVLAPDLAADETLRLARVQPERADIVAADGTPIVTQRDVERIGIDKTKVEAQEALTSAAALAEALGIDSANYVAAVRNAGPRAFVPALTVRTGSPEAAAARQSSAPGILIVADRRALAPTASFARPILGIVGEATAEIIEESGGAVAAGDQVGIGGLQETLNDRLDGQPGVTVSAVGAGADPRVLFETAPEKWGPVTVTLDIDTQQAAETVLADVAPASAIVAIRPSSGAIVTAASGPGGKGASTATQGRYAPGSTFKTVSTLALLRAGTTPSTSVECTPTVTVDGRSFKNVDGYPASALGSVPFTSAFANSCNTAFIRAGEPLDPDALPTAAAGLGLTAEPSLGLPSFLGSVPEPEPGTDEAASMIGQSKVLASPLGMATVVASIAAGKPVTPQLVVTRDSGDVSTSSPSATPTLRPGPTGSSAPPPPPEAPVTAAEAATLRELMRGVVEQGSGRFLADVPGEPVLAKSGTAEFGDASALKERAWMIAIQGDLAVAVFVEEGEGGAATAGPLLEAFLRAVA
ncbi:penicillin-binding transpeptidase domain-containing protein [Knoellia sp. CPCC 206435]|uniref:penicillin-binding transpeptidase domain-containing protein n=1 Tax=Knoellia terrae TaxID=3404797 RepID=UPI003B43B635